MIGVVVLGPEASGTRYVTSLLEASSWDASNRLQRRSLPYDTGLPHLADLIAEMDRNDVRVVLTSRRADCLGLAQVYNGHAASWREALKMAERCYTWAIVNCSQLAVPFLLTAYEAFADPSYRCWVSDWAWDSSNHDAAVSHGFVDGNAKYLTDAGLVGRLV